MVNDLISRQRLLSVVKPMVGVFEDDGFYLEYESVISAIENAPTIDADDTDITQKALEAGKRGEEVRFYIGGRKFAVRELPQ